jgi:hypothetical protein
MELNLSSEEAAFRDEVGAFIAESRGFVSMPRRVRDVRLVRMFPGNHFYLHA